MRETKHFVQGCIAIWKGKNLPLRIDLLIIRKKPGEVIKNEIGTFFLGHNIIEYKSPDDSMNIDTFYKSGAYASLYKSYGESVDKRTADDITVSIVRQNRPDGLFGYFEKHKIRITNPYHGIYYVWDTALFPTQIIVTRKPNKKEHTWLAAFAVASSVLESSLCKAAAFSFSSFCSAS